MSKNKSSGGIVYSTNPDFKLNEEEEIKSETLPEDLQPLRIRLDTKQRAGKAVTLITGFSGKAADLELLGRKLKTQCGTGGAIKHGGIIIQGDNRVKIFQWLQKNGYKSAKQI